VPSIALTPQIVNSPWILTEAVVRRYRVGNKISDSFEQYNKIQSKEKELVMRTLNAVQDCWYLPAGVIFHSDRGSQYTSSEVMTQIAGYGWRQSFSAVGKPGDNAWSESFFSILKKEAVHWHFYPTREAARQAIFQYIEVFYNRRRTQKRLGYLSPIQFLNA
jgi:putative transposase